MTPGSTRRSDDTTGGCGGVLVAVRDPDRPGAGPHDDAALQESAFRCTDELAPALAMLGPLRERAGSSHIGFAVPQRCCAFRAPAGPAAAA